MSLKIVRSASRKLKSTVMFVASFALALGSVSFVAPQFLSQIAYAVPFTTWNVSSVSSGACTTLDPSCSTIQSAVDQASPGDTINVAAGTYNLTSRIDVNKAVSIIGDVTTPSNVVINAPVAGGTQHGQNSVFMITSSNVTVQGFKIQGALHTGAAQNAGIYVDDPKQGSFSHPGLSGITIRNNEVTNNGYGIVTHNTKNSTISNNKVFSNKKAVGAGKYRESGVGIVIYGNAVDANHTSNLTINGNDVYDNDTEGIRVGVGSDIGSGYLVLDMAITISYNNIYHNGSLIADTGFDTYIGIKSSGWSNGVTVTGNNIYNHTGTTIKSTSGNAGIQIHASKGWSISSNNIHNNINGIIFANSGAGGATTGSHTITGNNITNNIRGISIDRGSEAVANNNSIYGNNSTAFSGTPFLPYGVYNSSAVAFNATNNYWGSPDPTFATIISEYVSYDPWYVDAGMTTLSNAPVVVVEPVKPVTPNPQVPVALTPVDSDQVAFLGDDSQTATTDVAVEPAVLGTQTTKKTNTNKSATPAIVAATDNAGLSWYWLLAIPAAIGAGWWATAAYRRRDS